MDGRFGIEWRWCRPTALPGCKPTTVCCCCNLTVGDTPQDGTAIMSYPACLYCLSCRCSTPRRVASTCRCLTHHPVLLACPRECPPGGAAVSAPVGTASAVSAATAAGVRQVPGAQAHLPLWRRLPLHTVFSFAGTKQQRNLLLPCPLCTCVECPTQQLLPGPGEARPQRHRLHHP
jgi:hypothetical protein